jgi:hypothetical protein
MEYVKSWEEPDYPHGQWIEESEWEDTGIEEIFKKASEAYEQDISDIEEGFFAVYTENDMGMERLMPLEYSGEGFETVKGVFDSNPGVTQRYTPWHGKYSEKGLEQDLEAMDGKLIELDEIDIDLIEQNFSYEIEKELDLASVINGVAGVFWKN